tara:strand:+ start:1461 stop:1709 length:249 start_codon:yes stop_codon:yes gene_type:complete
MKNGQLWYNLNTERVERVVGTLNKTRVFTVSHGYTDLKPVRRSSLLQASGVQVQDYLKESREIKNKKRVLEMSLPSLPSPIV